MERFTAENFYSLCDGLAEKDPDLRLILDTYQYPPFWTRENSFATLVLTILEQQVSLASAYAAYKKLKEKLPDLRPKNFLTLSDEDLRNCYFSRQKIVYTRELAHALVSRKISLKKLFDENPDTVRMKLKALKGIGDWTVDIYLIHALRQVDVFPVGDLALVNAVKMVKKLPAATREDLIALSQQWKPYRSIATMLFWHYYIRKKNIKLLH